MTKFNDKNYEDMTFTELLDARELLKSVITIPDKNKARNERFRNRLHTIDAEINRRVAAVEGERK